jgi:hypothetical protein
MAGRALPSATDVDDRSKRETISRGDRPSDERNVRAHGIVEHAPFVLMLFRNPLFLQMVERRLAGCNAMASSAHPLSAASS